MSRTLAAILGGAAGAVALVGIVILIIWFCLSQRRSVSRTSETGSSDPSVQGNVVVLLYVDSRGFCKSFVIYYSHNLQLEEMLEWSWHYEKQGPLIWLNCLWPQKILAT